MRRPTRRGGLLAGLLILPLVGCAGDERGPGPATVTASREEGRPSDPTEGPTGGAPLGREPGVAVVDTVASGLRAPWGLGFLPDGRAVVTERDTRAVLLVDPDGGEPRQVGVLGEPVAEGEVGEGGLLGVAVSPDFDRDRSLYFYLSTAVDNRVVRARLGRQERLGTPEVLLEGIPTGFIHDGGRLRFGPDGLLYVSTGETGSPELAQDRASLAGKILRLTPDGRPAPGNPDPDSPVWTWGHRNVQGLAFDDDGRLWASEFGEQTYDELNLIEAGDNYGWPTVEGRGEEPGLVDPQVVWDTDLASPSGLAYAEGHVWLGALQGARLWRVPVDGGRAGEPTSYFVGDYGRLRTVEVAPDGRLWVTTSNRDGRGSPADEDDRILVVRPGTR